VQLRAKNRHSPQIELARRAVKKTLATALYGSRTPNFFPGLIMRTKFACRYQDSIADRPDRPVTNGETMAVVAYVLLTVAVFAVLGIAQKLVEKL
jgi:hypothetical protein